MTSRLGKRSRALALALSAGLGCLAIAALWAPVAATAPGDLADLSVSKSDSPDPVFVLAPLTYAIQVANLGPQGATGVTLTDRLPGHTDFVSATASSGSCQRKGRKVTCEVGDLAADPSKANAVSVTIVVRPTKVGTLTNTASVDSAESDPVSVNDSATTTTTVSALALPSSCRGVTATATGTPGSDRLVGTAGRDVIAGLGGSDLIFGLGGRDLICAGAGNDRVTAGSAADRVFGGAGRDRIQGRGGADLLAGNPGGDDLIGGAGNDRLRGGRGFDLCRGGSGFDRISGCER